MQAKCSNDSALEFTFRWLNETHTNLLIATPDEVALTIACFLITLRIC